MHYFIMQKVCYNVKNMAEIIAVTSYTKWQNPQILEFEVW
jgi:hypothetical protein